MRFLALYLGAFLLLSCKQDGSTSLNILTGGGGPTNATELEITSRIPDQGQVIVEIGESQEFFITGVAVFPRTVTYSWTLDGALVNAINDFTFIGLEENIGNHTLIATLSDDQATISNTWEIKVNGPPVVSGQQEGQQKISVGSTLSLNAVASDPNNDSLNYRWLLNGATSTHLLGTTSSAQLTGHESIVGLNTVTVEVDDGTQTASHSWDVEVNFFPQACNELETGEICTVVGSANKGSGFSPTNVDFPLRFRPISHFQDSLGNFFISDLDNNVVWYWNNTANPVSRIGRVIPAGVIQVVAGTGEAASGSAGLSALESALNGPRGLWYDGGSDRLFISEWSSHTVKYVNSSGVVFIGMGGGTSHVDGASAFTHRCRNPNGISLRNDQLYVTCYTDHRVKRWDLSSDQAYTVAGTGANNTNGNNVAPTSGGTGQAYGLFTNDDGIYITLWDQRRVRFINTSLVPKTFWSGNPDEITVGPGLMATIVGNGGNGNTPASADPLSAPVARPSGISVSPDDVIYISGQQRSHIVAANNSGVDINIDGLTIVAGQMGRINSNTAGYNGTTAGVNATRFSSPYHLSLDILNPERVIIADYNNFRLRDINVSTAQVTDFLGSGVGKNGNMGDFELPTSQHLLNFPTGLAFDNQNQLLFVADQNNHRVRVLDRYGLVKTAVGSITAGDPIPDNEFPNSTRIRSNFNTTNSYLNGFDIWEDGSLLQLNSYGHNVRIWNRSGSDQSYFGQFLQDNRVSTIAGNWVSGAGDGPEGPALAAQLTYPNSAKFFNNAGQMEMFIVDSLNHCIRHVDSTGELTTAVGDCGTAGNPGLNVPEGSAQFNRPRDVAIDSHGNLFISDSVNHHIWYWNRSAVSRQIGTVTVNPNHIAVIACMGGTAGSTAENILATSSRCNTPIGLALHENSLCYAQAGRHNVRCMDTSTGILKTVAGRNEATPGAGSPFDFSQEGIPGNEATLQNPSGLTFDSNGDLYVSDTYNHIVRKIKLSD